LFGSGVSGFASGGTWRSCGGGGRLDSGALWSISPKFLSFQRGPWLMPQDDNAISKEIMMQLGDFYKEHLNEQKIDQIIEEAKAGKIILHDK
jgi:hypothetical protein